MKIASRPLSNGKHTVTPYIAVKGAKEFIEFLKRAFDAKEFGRFETPDGKIGHAEMQIGDSTIMLFESKPEWPDMPSLLSIYVDDVDDVYNQVLSAGGTVVTELMDFAAIGDRAGRIKDPFGNLWWLQTHVKDVTPEEVTKILQDPKNMESMQKAQSDAEKFFSKS
jgi:PhnB protein